MRLTIIIVLASAAFIAVLLVMMMGLRNKTKAYELEVEELKEQVVKSAASSRSAEQESDETGKKIEELTQNSVQLAAALQQQQQHMAKREQYVKSLETQVRDLTSKLNDSTCGVTEDEVRQPLVSSRRVGSRRRGTVARSGSPASAGSDQVEIGKLE